jgi:intraflagellar transport protein 88
MRARITRNTGNTFVKLRNFPEAITQYEKVLNDAIPDHQTAFNLVICYYAGMCVFVRE